MVLDRLVPSFQAVERHSTTIAAAPDQVWAALSQVTTGELRVFRVLMGVRVLPGWLVRSPRTRCDADEPLLGWAVRFGFTILGEDVRRELVRRHRAAVAACWRPRHGVAGGNDFAAFDQAGYAKMATSFRLDAIAGGSATRLSTETRVACTDAASARRFARYWRLIRPASGAIRRSWLSAIKRRAERRGDGEADPEVPARGRRCAARATAIVWPRSCDEGVRGAEQLERGGCVHRGSGSSLLANPTLGSQHDRTGHHGADQDPTDRISVPGPGHLHPLPSHRRHPAGSDCADPPRA
jgi:hypothetical protein